MSDRDRTRRLAAELDALPPLAVEMDGLTALAVLGSLQLAFRHPAHLGPSRRLAYAVARALEEGLARAGPEAARVAAAGWLSVFDEPTEGGGRG